MLDDSLIELIFELLNEEGAVGGVKLDGVAGTPADWLECKLKAAWVLVEMAHGVEGAIGGDKYTGTC